MNKLTKGALAGAAGLTLLLGGGTTFALWNSVAAVPGGTIVAGNLVVTVGEDAGEWTHLNGPILKIDDFRLSPGDELIYTKTMHIAAEGDNLVAQLNLTPGSIAASTEDLETDENLADYLQQTAVLTAEIDGVEIKPAQDSSEAARLSQSVPAEYIITPGGGVIDEDVTVSVTITFPKATTGAGFVGFENAMKTGSVSLTDMAVSLTQL
jgi:alternate signal-mediated exported protein